MGQQCPDTTGNSTTGTQRAGQARWNWGATIITVAGGPASATGTSGLGRLRRLSRLRRLRGARGARGAGCGGVLLGEVHPGQALDPANTGATGAVIIIRGVGAGSAGGEDLTGGDTIIIDDRWAGIGIDDPHTSGVTVVIGDGVLPGCGPGGDGGNIRPGGVSRPWRTTTGTVRCSRGVTGGVHPLSQPGAWGTQGAQIHVLLVLTGPTIEAFILVVTPRGTVPTIVVPTVSTAG
ncbi:MAG: hypothetical protein ACI38U_13190 [Corynebacterium sp.]|uniref:hypothetical protein n=1 Tax=Corynebacterium sp. TaxID=1720 RepID=UPI0011151922